MGNVTVLSLVNRMGSPKSPILTKISRQIWKYCLENQISLTAEYLAGALNVDGDWESRQTKSSSDWKINRKVFNQLKVIFGTVEVDLFADRQNAQLQKCVSWRPDPFAMATDALQMPWTEMRGYALPPCCIINRWLAKIAKESADNNCDTGVANVAVLSNAAKHVNPSACVTASKEVFPNRPRREPSPTDRNGNVEISGVESFRRSRNGISERASELLVKS